MSLASRPVFLNFLILSRELTEHRRIRDDRGEMEKNNKKQWLKNGEIVQFRIRLDRWLKALRTHLYRVNLDLK